VGTLDDQHTEGVALIMSFKMGKTLIIEKPSVLPGSTQGVHTKLSVIVKGFIAPSKLTGCQDYFAHLVQEVQFKNFAL